jgi:type II secretory pathway pseudopilin PulG
MTLIEILLALIVMVLGVLGVLAVFPVAMESAKESLEETNAALVGESVAQGITNGMRLAYYDPASGKTTVSLTHDLLIGSVKMKYRFVLPKILNSGDPQWMHFPSTTSPADPDPGQALPSSWVVEDDKRYMKLAGDGWVVQTLNDAQRQNSDPTDAYNQFAFSFDIKKVFTLEYLLRPVPQPNPAKPGSNYTMADLDPLMKLFEFRIYIYRCGTQSGAITGGGGTGGGGAGSSGGASFQKLVGIISKRIAAP